MRLVKSCIAITIGSLLSISTLAAEQAQVKVQEDVADFYGKLNISLQASDEGDGSFNELKSNASRVGVKGKYKLDTDYSLTAIYKLEWQVNVNDSNKDSLTARNQWVGVKGGFGELTVGRADTTLKVSQGKFDLFNDYEGDLKHLFVGENRVTDSITYKSPVYSNVQLLSSFIIADTSEDPDAKNPYSIGILFGDLSLKKTDFFLSVAHDENMPVEFDATDDTSRTEALANTRVTGMYKFGNWRVGGMFVNTEVVNGGNNETGYAANVSYKFGNLLTKVQYQEFAGGDAINIGADYKLGKNTKVYAWYTDRSENIFTAESDGKDYVFASEGQYVAIGMEQKF